MPSEQDEKQSNKPPLAWLAKWVRWIAPVVILAEVILLLSGIVGLGDGVLVIAAVEASLLVLVLFEARIVWRAVRRARAAGVGGMDALTSSLRAVMPNVAAAAVKHDLLMLRASGWWCGHAGMCPLTVKRFTAAGRCAR